eukprot:Skav205317  [mRNA]  locus=scaffold3444:204713:205866:+ [translate_table: standard]
MHPAVHPLSWDVVQVLGYHSDALGSSFLSLGGDSVTALRCAAAARQRGLDISALTLLRAKSLADAVEATIEVFERQSAFRFDSRGQAHSMGLVSSDS